MPKQTDSAKEVFTNRMEAFEDRTDINPLLDTKLIAERKPAFSTSLADSVIRTSKTTKKLTKSKTPQTKETHRTNPQQPMMTVTCRLTPEEHKILNNISQKQNIAVSRVGRDLIVAGLNAPVIAATANSAIMRSATDYRGKLEASLIEAAKIDLLTQSFRALNDDSKTKFMTKIMMPLSWKT